MRLLKLSCLLLMIVPLFTACEKDDDDNPSIVGFWKGKYGDIADYPTLPWSMLFRDNGTVRIYDGNDTATASKAEGTYTVSNATVNTTYVYSGSNQFSTSATINPMMTFQEGTFGSGTNTTNGGRFFIVKQ